MAKGIDLRTYIALERAFVRRLQRSWHIQSAPTYQKITQACLDHQWDEARRLVPDLDMAEVGTENREWITYMFLSCAVFGANIIAKKTPSFVGVGTFDTFLKQTTNNMLQYLEYKGTAQVQAAALQSIAEDEAQTKALKVAFDPAQPRDARGRWSVTTTPEFKAWFGDWEDPYAFSSRRDPQKIPVSQGVESYGVPQGKAHVRPMRPKVYYHGTRGDVETFEVGRPGMNSNVFGSYETTRHALFFAETPAHAHAFTSQGGETKGANVLPVYLQMQAPLDLTQGISDDTIDELAATGETTRGWLRQHAGHWSAFDDADGAAFVKALTKAGYDSVIFWDQNPDTREDAKTIAVFGPKQVKSALGNRSFDPRDPRITKWDESKHPRDKEGQFTEAANPSINVAEEEKIWPIEGGGPERQKWATLNQAAIEAGDREWKARNAHTTLALQFEQKYPQDTPYTEYEDEDFEAYRTTHEKALEAGRALEDAEEALKRQESPMKIEVVTNLANDVAKEMGVHPWHIHVVDIEPPEFIVGGKVFTEGGHYSPGDEQAEINVRNLSYGNAAAVKGIVAHELSHFVWHTIKSVEDREFQRYLAKAVTEDGKTHTPWYHERFEPDPEHPQISRRLKAAYVEEMAKEFPATSAMSLLAGGELFSGISSEMIKENGHSAYAKSYWTPEARNQRGGYDAAINETIAEVTRYLTSPKSWREDQAPSPTSPWVILTKRMHEWYRTRQARITANMAKSQVKA